MAAFHGSDLEKIEQIYGIKKEEITGFGANVNPLGLSSLMKDYLAGHLDVLRAYPDRNYTALRRAIADYVGTAAENIMVGNGSTELISAAIQAIRPQAAVVLGPAYSEYERELTLAGSELHYYDLSADNDFVLDLEDLEHFLISKAAGTGSAKGGPRLPELLVLCNPNNPTSSAVPASQMRLLLSFCRENKIFVMTDETYAEFAPSVNEITSIPLTGEFDNLLVLRGVSKFWSAPGLRLGYAVTSSEALRGRIEAAKNPWTVSSLADAAGQIMFTDTEYIARTRSLIGKERERCIQMLAAIPDLKVYPACANFVLSRSLNPEISARTVFEAAIRRKMMIRDCSDFHSLNDSYFRFCFLLPEDNTRLLSCIRELFSRETHAV